MTRRVRKIRKDKITFNRSDIKKVEKMAGLGLTIKQISSVFDVSSDTLQRRAKENQFNLSASLTKGKSELEMELGNKAVELARAGNTSMLKYVLGCRFSWTEKQQIVIEEQEEIEEESHKTDKYSLDDLTLEELEELEKLQGGFIVFEEKLQNRLSKIKMENPLNKVN